MANTALVLFVDFAVRSVTSYSAFVGAKSISHPCFGYEVARPAWVGFQFSAQVLHAHPKAPSVTGTVRPPHLANDLILHDYGPEMPGERLKDTVLERSQVNVAGWTSCLAMDEVDSELP